jgi:hypothetical protein
MDCLLRGINVVYSQLDLESARVYGYFVRPSHALAMAHAGLAQPLRALINDAVLATSTAGDAVALEHADKASLASLLPRFGLRQTIFFFALAAALEDNRKAASADDWESLGKLYLIHLVLIAHLPLKARAQSLGEPVDRSAFQGVEAFLSSIHKHSLHWLRESDAHLESLAAQGTSEASSILAELADFADGRLFFKVLDLVQKSTAQPTGDDAEGLVTALGFTPAMAKETLDAWSQTCLISRGSQAAAPFFPLRVGGTQNFARSAPAAETAIAPHQLSAVSCSLTRAVLGDELSQKLNVREGEEEQEQEQENTKQDTIAQSGLPAGRPVESYHWHSGRALEDDLRHNNEANDRQAQKYIKFMHTFAESLEGT